jgi:hypothetical protein
MTVLRILLVLIAVALATPATAADVVYPTGSRIGLVPPPNMVPSTHFFGFEDSDNKVALIIIPLPPQAYGEIARSTEPDALLRQGVTMETREEVTLSFGKAALITGRQELDNVALRKWIVLARLPDITVVVTAQVPEAARQTYSDAVMRASLTSLALRAAVPIEEQLSLLPFKVNEMAGFRVGGLLAGRAVMLTDAAAGSPAEFVATHMVVSIAPGGPTLPADRETFARDVFATIPALSDVRLMSSEPLRIGNQQGHQIMARAKDAVGADVTVVQWLRFGGGAYMQMIGTAPTIDWIKAYARFRQVRDGVELR